MRKDDERLVEVDDHDWTHRNIRRGNGVYYTLKRSFVLKKKYKDVVNQGPYSPSPQSRQNLIKENQNFNKLNSV